MGQNFSCFKFKKRQKANRRRLVLFLTYSVINWWGLKGKSFLHGAQHPRLDASETSVHWLRCLRLGFYWFNQLKKQIQPMSHRNKLLCCTFLVVALAPLIWLRLVCAHFYPTLFLTIILPCFVIIFITSEPNKLVSKCESCFDIKLQVTKAGFKRRTLHVPNLMQIICIRFGTCKMRRLQRALKTNVGRWWISKRQWSWPLRGLKYFLFITWLLVTVIYCISSSWLVQWQSYGLLKDWAAWKKHDTLYFANIYASPSETK